MITQCSLHKRSAAVSVSLLDQVVNLRIGQLKRCYHLGDLWSFRQVVDEGIGRKRKYYFGGREFTKDPRHKRELHLREPSLVEKENRASRTGLSLLNRCDNTLDLILEETVSDNDPVVIGLLATFSEDPSQMVRVRLLLIDKIEPTIDVKLFRALLV